MQLSNTVPFPFAPLPKEARLGARYAPPSPPQAVVQELGQAYLPSLPAIPGAAKSVALPAAGGAALFLGGLVLPGTIGTVSTLAGLGLLGYAGYKVLVGEPPAPETPAVAPPTGPAGLVTPQFAMALEPNQINTGGTSRNMWTAQEYELVIRNTTPNPVALFAGLAIYDDEGNPLFVSPTEPVATGRKQVTVPPGSVVKVLLNAPPLGLGLPQSVSVEAQGFRNMADMKHIARSEAIPIKYSFVG